MERLAQIMLDYPSLKKLSKTEFAITALKPAVMWMIANEAVNINKVEKATFGDVLEGLSKQIPSVCKIITWAILNDKERIEKDFEKVYDTLYWECDVKEWAELLFEILNLISVDTFFAYRVDTDVPPNVTGQENDEGRTKTVIARTSYGEMFDFIKAYPSVTMEQYMWHMTVPQILLAQYDTTHIEYLSEEQAKKDKAPKINSTDDLFKNDFGIPIFNQK